MRNKTLDLHEHLVEHDIDVMAVTETWLKENDEIKITELLPPNYKIVQRPRGKNRPGGGVAIIHKDSLDVSVKPNCINATAFEHLEICITFPSKTYRIILVYRPPPSKKN